MRDGRLFARCGGGGTLAVLALEIAGAPCGAQAFVDRFGTQPVVLAAREHGHV
jgi:hypothetical protein